MKFHETLVKSTHSWNPIAKVCSRIAESFESTQVLLPVLGCQHIFTTPRTLDWWSPDGGKFHWQDSTISQLPEQIYICVYIIWDMKQLKQLKHIETTEPTPCWLPTFRAPHDLRGRDRRRRRRPAGCDWTHHWARRVPWFPNRPASHKIYW